MKNSNFKEEAQEALLNYIDNEKNKTNDVTKDLKEFNLITLWNITYQVS